MSIAPPRFALAATLLASTFVFSAACPGDDPPGDDEGPVALLQVAREKIDFASAGNREEAISAHVAKVVAAMDRVAAHKEATADHKAQAVSAKLRALYDGALADPKKYEKPFDDFAGKLQSENPKGDLAQRAAGYQFAVKHIFKATPSPTLPKDVLEFARQRPKCPFLGDFAAAASGMLERADKIDEARSFLGELAGVVRGAPAAEAVKKLTDELAVLGTEMEISGPTLAGSQFDVKSLRGKVVLVDYWATWCAPCIDEIPNVRDAYKKYHGRGFEVVGVSLDNDPQPLETFVKAKDVPWTQIIHNDDKLMGWSHPLAKKYKVTGIPATFLLNREGKVVARNLRGPKLEAAIEKLLDAK